MKEVKMYICHNNFLSAVELRLEPSTVELYLTKWHNAIEDYVVDKEI